MVLLHLKEVSLCFVKKVTTSSRCHGMAPIIKHLKFLVFNIIFFFLKCMLCVFLSSVRRDVSFYLINFYLRLFLVIIRTFTLRFCFCCGGPLCVIYHRVLYHINSSYWFIYVPVGVQIQIQNQAQKKKTTNPTINNKQ
jgi:hypothetical protein